MEIEFKFCIPPERLAAVQAAMRRGRWTPIRMEARYFDTPDAALSSRGIALRLRREGAQWVQTVKALGQGPLDREEHNVLLGDAPASLVPRPELHAGSAAGARLVAALQAVPGPLVETYGTEIDRVTRNITLQGAAVELALDTGRVVAHRGTAQQREARICELELELTAGPVAGLAALATRWATRHGLYLSTVSKAERGERLLAAQAARPATRASALVAHAAGAAFWQGPALQRAVVAHCLQQVLANSSEIAAGAGTDEHVHQLRIGLRRLRSALQELAPLAPGRFDPTWEAPVVDVFRRLGELRDRSQVLQSVHTRVQAVGAPALAGLDTAGAATPSSGAAEIVRNAAFQTALIGLMAFTARGHAPRAAAADDDAAEAPGPKDIRRLLQKRLRRLHTQVREGAQGFAALTVPEQHRLRKRLKRLRYLTEFMAPALDADSAGFVDSLQPALSALGRLNDERVARELYEGVAATGNAPGAWFGLGWLAAHEAQAVAACEEALSHMADAPRLRKGGAR